MTTSITPESILLQQLQQGDHGAFEKLYRIHSTKIYYQFRQMVRDEDDADELLQDLFVRIWERRSTIDPSKPFGGLIHTVARNMAVDYFRKLTRTRLLYDEVARANSEIVNTTAERIDAHETSDLLEMALSSLPPQRKTAFQLCKLEGKTHQQAAEIMHISPNTVHNHLVQATLSIRQFLEKQHKIAGIVVALSSLQL